MPKVLATTLAMPPVANGSLPGVATRQLNLA